MQVQRLMKKVGIYFIGNLSTKLMSAIVVFLYAFYIKAEELGQYEYIQTLVNIVVPIAFVSIWEAILKYILGEKNNETKQKIINTSAIFSIAISILIIIFGTTYYCVIKKEPYAIYIILTYFFYGLSTVWQYYARCLNETKTYVKASVIGSAVSLMFTVFLICVLKLKVEALFIVNIIGNFTIVSVIEFKLKILKKIELKQFDTKILKKMLIFSMPLVINDISLWLITGFSKVIIQNILGSTANGMYSFANKFTIIVSFIGMVLNKALTEEMLSLKLENVKQEFETVIKNISEKVLMLLIICIPAIMIVYNLIQNTEYYQSKIYVPILMLYTYIMFISTNLSNVFKIAEKTKYQFYTTLAGAITTVIVSFLTIYTFGIFGVIFAQLLGALVNIALRYIFAKKMIKIKIKWNKNIAILMLYIIVAIISIYSNLSVNIMLEIIVAIVILIIYKSEIVNLIKLLKKYTKIGKEKDEKNR